MNLIRWGREDISKLSRAVTKYNRVVENKNMKIPKINYNELKNDIFTRKELNRQLEKLNSLTESNYETWEETEFQKEIKLAKITLKNKLKNFDPGEYMTSVEYAALKGELRNINRLNDLPLSFRKKKIERIKELASADYDMKDANNYREWYIKTIDEYYSGFAGYKKLKKKIESIKNPQKFYEHIKESINVADIYYLRYSRHTQALFNLILHEWGLDVEEDDYEEY